LAGVTVEELQEAHAIANPDFIQIGERLVIPTEINSFDLDESRRSHGQSHQQKQKIYFKEVAPLPPPPPQSRSNRAFTNSPAPSETYQDNNMMQVRVEETVSPELPPLSVPDDYLPNTPMKFTGYIWPAKGVLTSGYGWRWGRMHKGVDIAAPIGTPIAAAAAGEVISAGWNSGGYGNLVKIKHPDGSVTLYAHNSRILVRSGQMVEQGDLIALMGSTGYSTGPHLHFEIHPPGQGAVNPIAYLPR
jgi:murein DD-endopeptidase MepM/ murein hydrolase activator NlpD